MNLKKIIFLSQSIHKFRLISKQLYVFSQIELSDIQRKNLLQKKLKDMKLKTSASILMQDEQEIQERKKRKLTKQQKLSLGLYVPSIPLNPRLGLHIQQSYRETICQSLYSYQQQHLPLSLRILQQQTDLQNFTINKYINTIYKDIYARYLISRGLGVEWKGQYCHYGVMNSKEYQNSPDKLVIQFLTHNIKHISKIESIAPYSYLTQKFIPSDLIQVQNLRKIGYFLKVPLVDFGKHTKNFQKIIQNQNKIQLLVFCQYLQKLINPHNLCVMRGHKLVILKRIPQSSPLLNAQYEYLITSMQIFTKHKQFFIKEKYEKHLIFDSQHLIDMKAQYKLNTNNQSQGIKLKVIQQVQGYQRNPGIYLVNGATSLPDYQRVKYNQDQHQQQAYTFTNVVDANGNIQLITQGINNKFSLLDLQFQQKIHQQLKAYLPFIQLYDIFQDQIYSHKQNKQLLRFRIFQKYQIPLEPSLSEQLKNFLSSSKELFIHQSKIQLPPRKIVGKPRERRQRKKLIKELEMQKTPYMTIINSIDSINNIPITSSIQGDFAVYFILDQNNKIKSIVANITEINIQDKGLTIEKVVLSADLISALTYMNGSEKNIQFLPSIIIQAQTFTEQILPLCLHLTNFMKDPSQKRGRKVSSSPSLSKKFLQSLKMIYLHPTINQAQRNVGVDSFIQGSMKIDNKRDFGYGYEAIRLWVCRNSQFLGDRELKQAQVNQQLKHSLTIRKVYSQLLPLLPTFENLSSSQTQLENLSFLDAFMLHQIDSYIANMEQFYSKILLKEAYQYTIDFYKNIIDRIFVQTIRRNIITYPNLKQNVGHSVVIRRILELLSVIAPLFPFSAYHISKTQLLKWPVLTQRQNFFSPLLQHNVLLKIRTQLHNKLLLNNFRHCEVYFPQPANLQYTQKDLELFFGVQKVTFKAPEVDQKKFGFQLRYNQTLGGKNKIFVYQSRDTCIRCDTQTKQKQHLCTKCVGYLQNNVDKSVLYYDERNNSLLKQDKPILQQKKRRINDQIIHKGIKEQTKQRLIV